MQKRRRLPFLPTFWLLPPRPFKCRGSKFGREKPFPGLPEKEGNIPNWDAFYCHAPDAENIISTLFFLCPDNPVHSTNWTSIFSPPLHTLSSFAAETPPRKKRGKRNRYCCSYSLFSAPPRLKLIQTHTHWTTRRRRRKKGLVERTLPSPLTPFSVFVM